MVKRIVISIIVIIIVTLVVYSVADNQVQIPKNDFTDQTTYKIVRVVDGDTVYLMMDGKEHSVRLIGVDTPETVHPSKPVEHYGREATMFTENLLIGEEVYIEREPSMTDKYGRALLYLYRAPDGLFVNLEIIRQGYANTYTASPFKYMELFRYYEGRAREVGKGLWNVSNNKDVPRPTTQQESIIVYATKTGTKYHRAGCRYLSSSSIPITLEEAKKRYSPCSVCNPPR